MAISKLHDVLALSELTAVVAPTVSTTNKDKFAKWERFMKFYGCDCQGNKLNTAS